MLRRLTQVAIGLIYLAGVSVVDLVARISGRRYSRALVVLVFHSIPAHARRRFAVLMDDTLRIAEAVDPCHSGEEADAGRCVAVTFDDALLSFKENALPALRERGIPATVFAPSDCLGQPAPWLRPEPGQPPAESVMSADELRELPRELVTIGAHCRTHPNLKNLTESEAQREICDSKSRLESLLGMKVRSMAFPYGAYDHTHVEMARLAGYERVFSSLPTNSSEYVRGRVNAAHDDWPLEFRLKVMGGYRWLPWAAAVKHALRTLMGRLGV